MRELAAKLTAGKTTREAKLRALFEFVADDIRYVNYVSGEWWLPNRPQQLLARREGDCDDKALLLITLLKAAGIDAQEVMVQTRMTNQPSLVRAQGAAIPLFDHGIAFLPGPGGGTYLDATSPQSRLGPLPAMDARAKVWHQIAERARLPSLVERVEALGHAIGGRRDLIGVDRVELLLLAQDLEIPEDERRAAHARGGRRLFGGRHRRCDRVARHAGFQPCGNNRVHGSTLCVV